MFFVSDTDRIDRYAPERFLEYHKEGDFNTLTSVFVAELRKLPLQSYVTSKNERPDLLAHKIYGDTQFTWIIMLYNSCIDFTDGTFVEGSQIRYPAIEDLERIIFTLKARKRAYLSETGKL